MQYAEDAEDVGNVEAWAEIVEDMLFLVPPEDRMKVLQLAVASEEAAIAERLEHEPLGKIWCASEFPMDTPGMRHWNAIMRLKSLIIQVFTRNITNDHSPTDAAKLLFADHRYGTGSGCLGDYIDDLPRSR